ncbi:hypothetical protein Xcel_0121 [Xylanimonas cellulosilytica DSM 15894]|uniref:AB hydrolase-1 domain-containing protein n=1 Tax=Xylanimonas cellulosilytica (strain DSM 15894 / JCM 12276 / CECT 5975 / KCTC 9989 / LMG 20990 / NBRC 107835 / XIL07) TaxID=446471 RepID=D1BTZ8_XYLCX|nr:alpha/beta hydrolase [Xylanimonas cellulosilytica]ACZ29162.1 hypothetical protein Xcel_0121 [Xylanimonas cellulosilytica DSM 15894]
MPTTTATIDVPGAVLTYDVHEPETSSGARPLFIIGSPMGAAGFATLVGHFGDRTVITYDPPGMDRSTITGDGPHPDPMNRGAALHAIADAVGLGPYDLFGSSGGAVDGLAWIQQFHEDLATAVLHEPPLAKVLPDSDLVAAAMDDVHATYEARGFGAGMAKFIALVSVQGELDGDYLAQPDPDPAQFGLPADDDGTRGDPLLGINMLTMQHWLPAFASVRAASTRIVPAYGSESGETMAARGARALAAELGLESAVFPGDHGAFQGGEYGFVGQPDEFAARLHEVLG